MIKNVARSAEPTASAGGAIGERSTAGAKDSKIGLSDERAVSTFVMLSQNRGQAGKHTASSAVRRRVGWCYW
ncbi:hypothetical protein ACQPZ8_23635 [Actinomadura nitritigenes]|uniref:hypothetical protein n=1 Tax=Actinomadura nitritigenes TaxID=134602 RepID=UPI003D909376